MDNEIHVTGNDIEDLLFKKDIDANVIHFCIKHLEQKGCLNSLFFRSEAWVIMIFILFNFFNKDYQLSNCELDENCDFGRSFHCDHA